MEQPIVDKFIKYFAFQQAVYYFANEHSPQVKSESVIARIVSDVHKCAVHDFNRGLNEFYENMLQENNKRRHEELNELCQIVLKVGEYIDLGELRKVLMKRWEGLSNDNDQIKQILKDSKPLVNDDMALFIYAHRLFADEISLEILSYGLQNPMLGKETVLPKEVLEALAKVGVA